MPRRVQRKPRWHVAERTQKKTTGRAIGLQDAITILGGITGIIAAILWIAGRAYMASYFDAMNIPAYQINFSHWEYAEAAWSRIALYLLSRIVIPIVLTASIALVSLLAILVLQRLLPNLKLVGLLHRITAKAKQLPRGSKTALAIVFSLYLIYMLLDISAEMIRSGQYQGKATVSTKSYAVEIYSKSLLPLGSPQVIAGLFRYEGLRLLTFNNGKYYLFRDVDQVTCKPSQVFIISDNPDIHLAVSAVAPLNTPCAKTPVVPVTQ